MRPPCPAEELEPLERPSRDDLVQDVYEAALSKLDQFEGGATDGQGSSAAWLFRIARNRFLNDRRYQAVRNRHLALVKPIQGTSTDGVALSELRAEASRTLQAVGVMPEEQRAVLLLVAAEGCSYSKAADILGLPQGTVMSRLSRARQALKALLDDAPEGDRAMAAAKG
ncbi:MAG: RNA polymerase sigma factor [Magnetospiraceae bacterium]